MAAYTIHLARVGGVRVDQTSIERDLRSWFGWVIRAARRRRPRYDGVTFNWITAAEEISVPDREILVYLLSGRSSTLLPRFGSSETPDAAHVGITDTLNNLTLSEVYCDCRSARFIAETIFQKALHNKTGWSNQRLHRRGGIADGSTTSITSSEITAGQEEYYRSRYSDEPPTPSERRRLMCRGVIHETFDANMQIVTNRNVRDMASFLNTRRPQWGRGLMPEEEINFELNLDNL